MKQQINLTDYGFNILQIESTAACNMACSFCPYPLKEDKKSKLDFIEIKKILEKINPDDDKFKYLTFSQFNEPLLDNRIFDILELAKDMRFKTYFVTNGLLLNKEKNINELLRLKPEIKISMQVLDNSKHKTARGLNLELTRYLETIINFCKIAKDKDLKVNIDIGCNFNDNKFKLYTKKFLGLGHGDSSVPDTLDETWKYLQPIIEKFYNIEGANNKDKIKEFLKNSDDFKKIKNEYIYQEGFKIFENIKLKIKPFFYGNRIKDFYPINDNFSCDSKILAIQADGNIVPCCLAYDDTISLGNVKSSNFDFKDLLDNNTFLNNLRKKGSKKHITCKKCYGEPTKRGVFFRNLLNQFQFSRENEYQNN
jgi:radical SAM protein with 4Fe4S-binding SPASM domain